MRKVDFNTIPPRLRMVELQNTNDSDIIRYSLQRSTGFSDENMDRIKIEFSMMRRRIILTIPADLIGLIMDQFAKLKLEPFSVGLDNIVIEMNHFFRRMI